MSKHIPKGHDIFQTLYSLTMPTQGQYSSWILYSEPFPYIKNWPQTRLLMSKLFNHSFLCRLWTSGTVGHQHPAKPNNMLLLTFITYWCPEDFNCIRGAFHFRALSSSPSQPPPIAIHLSAPAGYCWLVVPFSETQTTVDVYFIWYLQPQSGWRMKYPLANLFEIISHLHTFTSIAVVLVI